MTLDLGFWPWRLFLVFFYFTIGIRKGSWSKVSSVAQNWWQRVWFLFHRTQVSVFIRFFHSIYSLLSLTFNAICQRSVNTVVHLCSWSTGASHPTAEIARSAHPLFSFILALTAHNQSSRSFRRKLQRMKNACAQIVPKSQHNNFSSSDQNRALSQLSGRSFVALLSVSF